MFNKSSFLVVLFVFLLAQSACAQENKATGEVTIKEEITKKTERKLAPKITVTDLSYQETVANHFLHYNLHEKSSGSLTSRENAFRSSDRTVASSERTESLDTGVEIQIDRGEMRKFTADIKGELLKSGYYRLTQGKPWTKSDTVELYDIIKRIKEGYYPGADYVLFGSINTIDFRNERNPLQGSNAISYSMSLGLVAEFSLIDTKTFEVVAGFSAAGDGEDVRLVNSGGTVINMNKGKVMQEVSRSLGVAVERELESQFTPENSTTSFSFKKETTHSVKVR
jgi:hypothetical protein